MVLPLNASEKLFPRRNLSWINCLCELFRAGGGGLMLALSALTLHPSLSSVKGERNLPRLPRLHCLLHSADKRSAARFKRFTKAGVSHKNVMSKVIFDYLTFCTYSCQHF